MKRLTIAFIVLLVLVGLGLFGYRYGMQVADQKLRSVLTRVEQRLPAGASLTYGSMAINPFSLGMTMENLALVVPADGLGSGPAALNGSLTLRLDDISVAGVGLDLDAPSVEEITLGPGSVTDEGGKRITWAEIRLEGLDAAALRSGRPSSAEEALKLASFEGLEIEDLAVSLPAQLLPLPGDMPEGQSRLVWSDISVDGFADGRSGTVRLSGGSGQTPIGEGQIRVIRLTSLDLLRLKEAAAMAKSATANPMPFLQTFFRAMGRLDVQDLQIATPSGAITLDGIVMEGSAQDRPDTPLDRLRVQVNHLKMPFALVPKAPQEIVSALPTDVLDLSLLWTHNYDRQSGTFDIGPFAMLADNLGEMGFAMSLGGVRPFQGSPDQIAEELINAATFRSMGAYYADQGVMRSLAPQILARQNLSMDYLVSVVEGDFRTFLNELFGPELALSISRPMAAFMRKQDSLALDIVSHQPKRLMDMMLESSRSPTALIDGLSITVADGTPRPDYLTYPDIPRID